LKLSIIIPCFNENETINQVIEKILKIKFPIERELIIVDDGSRIQQKSFIKSKIDNENIKLLRLKTNQGKGTATRLGLKKAKGDVFIIQDADFEYNPEDILLLLNPILKHQVKVVYGSRFSSKSAVISSVHYLGNKILTRLTNFLYGSKLTDMETGYKMFTKEILENIKFTSTHFELEPEITSKVLKNGYKIIEVPISYHYRKFGYSKITICDGIDAALILLQNRYFENSRMFALLYSFYKLYLYKKFKFSLQYLRQKFRFFRNLL